MPRYRIIHRFTEEEWEVEAPFADDARRIVGWPIPVCKILMLRRGPFVEMAPPKVAVQVRPPKGGSVPICPDCNVSMNENLEQEFWWQCPSCGLLYHEWDNIHFRSEELDA